MRNVIEQGPIVGKFGGTSMAAAETISRAAEIVTNENMRAVVVSAPGRRTRDDLKVTDLLSATNDLKSEGMPFDLVFEEIAQRYESIGRGLNVHQDTVSWLGEVRRGMDSQSRDWILSRGEWLMANIFARFLGGAFSDAKDLIKLRNDGQIDPVTYQVIHEQLQGSDVHVIPGFYGRQEGGAIQIFPRGGSDITGAIVARGLNASEYQNWTDVDGVRAADPRIVSDARFIPEVTFEEMRELSYGGAKVLQMDSIVPAAQAGIPIVIRNTFKPDLAGTRIVPTRESTNGANVVGIAGRGGFVSIQIKKIAMNTETGFASRVLGVFRDNGISVEHDPTGIDTMSVIVDQAQVAAKEEEILNGIRGAVSPDKIGVDTLGLVCIVGQDIAANAGQIFSSFSNAMVEEGIDIKTVSFPTNGNSIIVGVPNERLNDAIRSVYKACIG